MKKLILVLIIPLLITGCSTTKTANNNTKVQELEQKIADLQSQQASTTATTSPTTTIIEVATPKPVKKNSESVSAPITQKETLVPLVTKSNDQICQDYYGLNVSWNGTTNSAGGLICDCKSGYVWNEQRTSCSIAPIVPIKSNDQICQDSYGLNSNWSGTKNNAGGLNCGCKSGYQWNQGQTQCVVSVIVPVKADDSVLKIAKCEAEKAEQTQTWQRVEDAAKQMTYTNTLTELNTTDPCGKAFIPEAIEICYNGHVELARSIAIQSYNEMHNKNLITIQNSYIACLNR